jgi:hypothetical protein
MGPDFFFVSLPEIITPVSLHPLAAALAALTAFDHALDGFKRVNVVPVGASVGDRDSFAHLGAWKL